MESMATRAVVIAAFAAARSGVDAAAIWASAVEISGARVAAPIVSPALTHASRVDARATSRASRRAISSVIGLHLDSRALTSSVVCSSWAVTVAAFVKTGAVSPPADEGQTTFTPVIRPATAAARAVRSAATSWGATSIVEAKSFKMSMTPLAVSMTSRDFAATSCSGAAAPPPAAPASPPVPPASPSVGSVPNAGSLGGHGGRGAATSMASRATNTSVHDASAA